jgi:hypothetical protein
MVNYNSDPPEKTTWTIKMMPAQARREVTTYAMRHGLSVAETMVEAISLLIERERGTDIIPPERANLPAFVGKPEGMTEANPVSTPAELAEFLTVVDAFRQAKEAGVPREAMTELRRRMALALGYERRQPPARELTV